MSRSFANDRLMKPGRKRSFDKGEALEKATRLFWASGYNGTSMRDLTNTLGINKPSLYAAFGNKEQLFQASLSHYLSCYGEPHLRKLYHPQESPLPDRIRSYMLSIAEQATNPDLPKGCLLVNSSCESGSEAVPEEISCALQSMRQRNVEALTMLFMEEKRRGWLAVEADCEQLSTYIAAVLYGIGVLASNGVDLEKLRPVIEITIHSLFCPHTNGVATQ